jgi:hypothetical protein
MAASPGYESRQHRRLRSQGWRLALIAAHRRRLAAEFVCARGVSPLAILPGGAWRGARRGADLTALRDRLAAPLHRIAEERWSILIAIALVSHRAPD